LNQLLALTLGLGRLKVSGSAEWREEDDCSKQPERWEYCERTQLEKSNGCRAEGLLTKSELEKIHSKRHGLSRGKVICRKLSGIRIWRRSFSIHDYGNATRGYV
jgi:hypothetical protein